ncbi:MAG TPA: aminotransferase class V-fold PLP-dependent enzyme [Nocardioides sp.]|jgi:kynureninase|uniref:kynureninase n=1 Tax=Nocardioides sp. TaxID=35761 RepID=UPI002E33C6B4|nr:aminotransferase class V-fold PLP-dependent enzyme [Nocardioides sp.]HEX3929175.1 aminotransferase class V-fold PLP-dependent enzyme [Nocardioides sp.]
MTHALDDADPLAALRERFVGTDSPLVYLDGNSLGRPLKGTAERLRSFVGKEWGERLIRGWDEGWFDLPLSLGDELGRVCLGAAPGQVTIGDSTTVLLYKLMRTAVAARPGRTEIVIDRDNFPTDRYLAEGVARECGLTVRWVDVDTSAGVTVEQVAEVVGEQTALVSLSHVSYRSSWVADVPGITRVAHDAGALVLWDLCHSVGSVPTELDAWEVDLAAGCTYKYLNGGPGSPAFCYVAERHLESFTQPIQGWLGSTDPFLMGPDYLPVRGIRRFTSGTPAVIGMLPVQDMVALIDEAGIDAVRAKSEQLTAYAVELTDEHLATYGVTVASPRAPERRGGHVTLHHPRMREVVTMLWQRDVLPDYRDPGGLRVGLSPLSTSYDELGRGVEQVRQVLQALD